jgi:hypothetical protein
LRKASRLEVVLDSLDGAGFAAAVGVPDEALAFSADQFGGGGLAGLLHENRNEMANKLKPYLNNGILSLIVFPPFLSVMD